MHRPLVGIAISAMLGTWLGFVTGIPLPLLLGVFAVLALLGLLTAFLRTRPGTRGCNGRLAPRRLELAGSLLTVACTTVAAWISADIHQARCAGEPFARVDRARATPMQVVGRIAGDPDLVGGTARNATIRTFPLKLEKVKPDDQPWQPASGLLNVHWYGPPPTARLPGGSYTASIPAYGERWRMEGSTRRERRGSYGFASYSFWTRKRASERLSRGPVFGLARYLLSARKTAADLLAVGIEDRPRTIGVLRALLLGYRTDLSPALHDLFATTGTLHIFAISGLHVGIICGLLIFVLSVMGIPRTRWILFLGPLLVAYTFATGAKASAVRACMMAVIYFSAPLAGRRADSLSALALAALLIVAWSPIQLFQVGFILSFVVVLGLILLYPLVYRGIELGMRRVGILTGSGSDAVLPLFWERDPAQVQDERLSVRFARRVVLHLASLLALSCAAWLASAPLTAYYFGRFAPIALLGNVLVIPLAFLVVLAGALSLVLGSCAALLADIFNHANMVLVQCLVGSMRWLSRIPGGSIPIPTPPPWLVLLWYAVLALLTYTLRQRMDAGKMIDNRATEWDDALS